MDKFKSNLKLSTLVELIYSDCSEFNYLNSCFNNNHSIDLKVLQSKLECDPLINFDELLVSRELISYNLRRRVDSFISHQVLPYAVTPLTSFNSTITSMRDVAKSFSCKPQIDDCYIILHGDKDISFISFILSSFENIETVDDSTLAIKLNESIYSNGFVNYLALLFSILRTVAPFEASIGVIK